MAASDTEIANSALIKLGHNLRILSMDEASVQAQLCKEQYPKLRDELLRSHPWGFAKRRVLLAALPTSPAWGFNKQYQLPADCLRVLEVDINDLDWRKEGDIIVTDSTDCPITYIAKVTEVGKWDANFSELLALKLAHDLSYTLTEDTALKKQLEDEVKEKERMTRSFNGQEAGIYRVKANSWRNSRY